MSQLSLDLREQANAVASLVAESSPDKAALVAAGSHSLALAARRAAARAKAEEHPILDLEPTATPAAVRAARIRRAVRRGRDVFLPSWSDFAVGLPNALLRSSLWSAGDGADTWMESQEIAALGQDVCVLYTGKQLTQYDRRVLAACLEYYKEDKPLSPGGSSAWVCLSFYQFAQGMGLAYTLNTHKALRASLTRLEAAALRVRTGQLELPVPRLLEVAFDDGYQTKPDNELKGSDQIAFRVLEQIATLYGPNAWSAVPKPALELKGLKAWISGFYATHSCARQLPFKTLQELSGMTCRPNDFRACVTRALDSLKNPKTPAEMQVSDYRISKDKKSITVSFTRWNN
nr:plasmid replication initiator TrfA [Comamonas thiooxydans]